MACLARSAVFGVGVPEASRPFLSGFLTPNAVALKTPFQTCGTSCAASNRGAVAYRIPLNVFTLPTVSPVISPGRDVAQGC